MTKWTKLTKINQMSKKIINWSRKWTKIKTIGGRWGKWIKMNKITKCTKMNKIIKKTNWSQENNAIKWSWKLMK